MYRGTTRFKWLILVSAFLVALTQGTQALAWTFPLTSAAQQVFMYVGTYSKTSDPLGVLNNSTVDELRLDVPVAQQGNNTPLTFPAARGTGLWGISCNANGVVVGAGYRNKGSNPPRAANVNLFADDFLVNGAGDRIPISAISWRSQSYGSQGQDMQWPETGKLGNVSPLTNVLWNAVTETCFVFSYANTSIMPPGNYTGTITFTVYVP